MANITTLQTALQRLVGSWRHPTPWDSADYLTEYAISVVDGCPVVAARDLNDGEEFIISQVHWDGAILRFHSLLPSTGREGVNEFSLAPAGALQSRFTFTVVEEFHRVGA